MDQVMCLLLTSYATIKLLMTSGPYDCNEKVSFIVCLGHMHTSL